ncbi:MAG: nucleotide exchange factor GrpE [Proteobacteria bacterium]|nr:nucleotide exchange factor GrpE [Pseudomonadota bacterium]
MPTHPECPSAAGLPAEVLIEVQADPQSEVQGEVQAGEVQAGGTPAGSVAAAPAAVVVAAAEAPADALAALQQQLTKTKDSWLRAAADLENHKRRARRDQLEAVQRAENDVVLLFLPVMDNVERAIEHAVQAGGEAQPNALLEGIRMVERQFLAVLARCGIEAQQPVGEPFDPQRHEAIQQQPSEQPAGTVVAELQKGYSRNGRLVRPALVVVSSGPAAVTVPAAGDSAGAAASKAGAENQGPELVERVGEGAAAPVGD